MSGYTSHFKAREFACKCCGTGSIQDSTREKIEVARIISGIPYKITSGFRCKNKQAKLIAQGKSKETSSHPKGFAVDIEQSNSSERWKIVCGLIKAGFKRIEIAKGWVHADDDPDKPQGVMWREDE